MAREFRLPDIGEGLTEAEIVRWLVPVGGYVAMDEPVVEVETDKALMEIPSPFAGTVMSHGAPEGAVVEVGEVLVVIGDPDEQENQHGSEGDAEASGESAPIVGTISSEAVDLTRPSVEPPDEVGPPPGRTPDFFTPSRPIQTLPMIRKMAKELGVDLSTVEGSGPGGRITREDVQSAAAGIADTSVERDEVAEPEQIESTWSPAAAEQEADQPEEVEEVEEAEEAEAEEAEETEEPDADEKGETGDQAARAGERMSATRRAIAEHMERSWREIPHVTTFGRVDVSRLLDARRALQRRHGSSVSIDAMVVKAVVAALSEHPTVASRLEGEVIVPPEALDIGVAVDTPEGLMVVVVDDPTEIDLIEMTAEIARLAEAARDRTLPPDRFRGQCFTVSNIGAVGGGYGTPIVPHGTSGILSVGQAEDTPVARDGAVVIAPMMPLSFSYDHRLIDGAAGRRFLDTVTENLAEPALFLA